MKSSIRLPVLLLLLSNLRLASVAANTQPRILSSPITITTKPILLNFDAIPHLQKVGGFYNGQDGGPDYGIVFGPGAYAINEILNQAFAFTNEPSPNNTLYLLDGAGDDITVRTGFTGLSFAYSEAFGGTVTFYDGPNGTGTALGNASLLGGGIDFGHNVYENWFTFNVSLPSGTVAQSVHFDGTQGYIDDMVFTVVVPPCDGPTYWVYNATTNKALHKLVNKSVTCLTHPYNIEARPCFLSLSSPTTLPVTIKLAKMLPDGRRELVHRRSDYVAPYLLWGGGSTASGDVVPSSPGPLPNGKYRLSSSLEGGGGRFVFTQACGCGDPPPGKKGCMNARRRRRTATTT